MNNFNLNQIFIQDEGFIVSILITTVVINIGLFSFFYFYAVNNSTLIDYNDSMTNSSIESKDVATQCSLEHKDVATQCSLEAIVDNNELLYSDDDQIIIEVGVEGETRQFKYDENIKMFISLDDDESSYDSSLESFGVGEENNINDSLSYITDDNSDTNLYNSYIRMRRSRYDSGSESYHSESESYDSPVLPRLNSELSREDTIKPTSTYNEYSSSEDNNLPLSEANDLLMNKNIGNIDSTSSVGFSLWKNNKFISEYFAKVSGSINNNNYDTDDYDPNFFDPE